MRVSLLLAEGIQAPSGRLVLPSCCTKGPDRCPTPLGRVRLFDAFGREEKEQSHVLAVTQVRSNSSAYCACFALHVFITGCT